MPHSNTFAPRTTSSASAWVLLTVLFTPVVLQILSEVLEFLTRVARKAVEDGIEKEVSGSLSSCNV